ncbi:hypothetical protein [Jiella sonneratiae]|uniref:Uncharacterized protein n=1 Tax=Jiella sonneratiae TaxID=2816856 RepID=A0ABS3IXG6_9HYPH|nr:hypothetical protein [Jiella sonneratiae]MBO0902106.1 hypothetical protein [Jiella sonneratiae]
MPKLKDYPLSFRHVRLELAREKARSDAGYLTEGHHDGYDLVVPLAEDGRLDAEAWQKANDKCRVRRFDDDVTDAVGILTRDEAGHWVFDYDRAIDSDDEIGFRFEDERFVPGEYVSVLHGGAEHTYRVAFVRALG